MAPDSVQTEEPKSANEEAAATFATEFKKLVRIRFSPWFQAPTRGLENTAREYGGATVQSLHYSFIYKQWCCLWWFIRLLKFSRYPRDGIRNDCLYSPLNKHFWFNQIFITKEINFYNVTFIFFSFIPVIINELQRKQHGYWGSLVFLYQTNQP